MSQPQSTVSRDIVLDGDPISTVNVVRGLALFIEISAGDVVLEVSPDGTNFYAHQTISTTGVYHIVEACLSIRVVSGTTPTVVSLRWNGILQ